MPPKKKRRKFRKDPSYLQEKLNYYTKQFDKAWDKLMRQLELLQRYRKNKAYYTYQVEKQQASLAEKGTGRRIRTRGGAA
jgi:hypothetical protein